MRTSGQRMRAATVVAVLVALAFPSAPLPASAQVDAEPTGADVSAAIAGGPYTIAEGQPLGLDASSIPGTGLSFAWDIDNDGDYDDANGETATVPWTTLAALGLDDDGGPFSLGLQVDDGTSIATHTTSLTITNAEPTITIDALDVAAVDRPYQVRVSAVDAGADTITSWTINWGDGTVDVKRGKPGPVNHSYTVVGLARDITVSVTDEDGTWTSADVIVPSYNLVDSISRHDSDTGATADDLGTSGGSLDSAFAAVVGPDGSIYVTGNSSNTVERYDPADSSHLGTFVSAGSGGLSGATGLTFGPDGNLYVASASSGEVLRYDANTGAFIDIFVPAGTLNSPSVLSFGTDGNLYVADGNDDNIERYDGSTGTYVDTFATLPPGSTPSDIAWGPNGNLYVSLFGLGRVDERNGTTGADVGAFVTDHLVSPTGLEFGPDDQLWVADSWTDEVMRFDSTTGSLLDTLVTGDSVAGPRNFTFVPDHQVSIAASLPAPLSANGWRASRPAQASDVPLTFEENVGQADQSLDFIASADGYVAVLEGGDAELSLGSGTDPDVRMELFGAVDNPSVTGLDRATDEGPTDGPQFASVEYSNVYSGIDVIYSANGSELEYSFVIAPGADPDAIILDFTGASGSSINADGELVVESGASADLVSSAPFTYQDISGSQVEVTSSYRMNGDGTIGFTLGLFDQALPLIIDPTFVSVDSDGGSIPDGGTLDLPAPGGVSIGDLLIAQIAYNANGAATITPPAGWNVIDVVSHPTKGIMQGLYWREATGSEPSQYSFTLSSGGSDTASGAIGAYSGVDMANPIDAFGGQTNGTSTSVVAPSITTTVADATLIGFFAVRDDGAITPPGGMTERWDVASGTGGGAIGETVAEAADENAQYRRPDGDAHSRGRG